MTKTYQSLLRQMLAGEDQVTDRQPRQSRHDFEMLILTTLLELMQSSGSDSVRVAAAKALIDQLKPDDEPSDDLSERERAHALAEIETLLTTLAAGKSGRAADTPQLDPSGTDESTYTPG